MTVWFTSDQHFGHKNIIHHAERPFSCLEDMENQLIERHNSVVRDGDVVFHLGDFCFDHRRIPGLLAAMKGRHRLVSGNHDRCHSCHRKAQREALRYIGYGFEMVAEEWREYGFLMNHMPYVADARHGQTYSQWRPVDRGEWLLHGHVHGEWKQRGRMINVGVDVWDYRPVALEMLAQYTDT